MQAKQPRQGGAQLGSPHNGVDKTMFLEILSRLKIIGKLFLYF